MEYYPEHRTIVFKDEEDFNENVEVTAEIFRKKVRDQVERFLKGVHMNEKAMAINKGMVDAQNVIDERGSQGRDWARGRDKDYETYLKKLIADGDASASECTIQTNDDAGVESEDTIIKN